MLSFTNLFVVMAIAFAAPLLLGLFPRAQLPSLVLEIVAGLAVGLSGPPRVPVGAWFALRGVTALMMGIDRHWSAIRITLESQLIGLALILLATVRVWEQFDKSNALTYVFAGGIALLLVGLAALWSSILRRGPHAPAGNSDLESPRLQFDPGERDDVASRSTRGDRRGWCGIARLRFARRDADAGQDAGGCGAHGRSDRRAVRV